MIKRAITIILALVPLLATAQSDSVAAHIVDRYLGILNIGALPADSMLVLTTTITSPTSTDTTVMKRYYQPPQMFRVEVRGSDGKLQVGLCTNGGDRKRVYESKHEWWRDVTTETFYNRLSGLDFRGPLYGWRVAGAEVTYEGKATVKDGATLDVVKLAAPARFTRQYLFEESGLLAVILESDELDSAYRPYEDIRIDWKCIHEYAQIGKTTLPSLESFMRKEELTVMRTEMHFEPKNNLLFNQD